MRNRATVIYSSTTGRPIPDLVSGWIEERALAVVECPAREDLRTLALRILPQMIIIDADPLEDGAAAVCVDVKGDPHTAVVPVVFIASRHETAQVESWFESGVDEVITPIFEPAEQRGRLDSLLARTQRNVAVHPTTMLPGTPEIEREIWKRISSGVDFAVCYTDLDYFKEYNDRYSYQSGDRIIYIVSLILRDTVTGMCPGTGFVGHIGGDDFIMILPLDMVSDVCSEVISIFDTLIALQYSEQDRRAGHFLGKDRRGQLHRVPIMTLSIGVVTSEHRRFEHPARVSALATEMKSYAKSLPGSVFVLDRRRDLSAG